jgi:hypothetical protein
VLMVKMRLSDEKNISENILPELNNLIGILEERTASPHNLMFASARSAKQIEKNVHLWINGKGPKPDLSALDARTALYRQSYTARQLEAFIQVSAVSALNLAKMTLAELENGEIIAPAILLRSIIERIAHSAALNAPMKDLPNISSAGKLKHWDPLEDAAEEIHRALMGTTQNWGDLADIDFRSVNAKKAKKLEYKFVEDDPVIDLGSIDNILKSVDFLDKDVPGIRLAYNVLCEFLHPNVGDFYGAITNLQSITLRGGIRIQTIELGVDEKNVGGAPQLVSVLSKSFDICGDALAHYPSILEALSIASKYGSNFTQRRIHKIVKSERIYEHDDLCPCLSGLKIRQCVYKLAGR